MPSDHLAIAHQSLSLRESPYLKHYQRGRFRIERGVALTGSELPGRGFNFAACLGPCPSLEVVTQMGRDYFGSDPWGIQVEGGAGHPIEAELIAAGWPIAEDEPAFVRPSLFDVGHLSNDVRQLTTEVDRKSFQKICMVAYGAPAEFAELMMPSMAYALDPLMAWFLIDRDGSSVAAAGYYRSESTAVICAMATIPAYRGHGIGSQLIQHILAHAKQTGCTNACLRSGPLSIPLYQRNGFEYVCQHRIYGAPMSE